MCWKYACTADTGQQIPLADPRDRQSTAFLQLEARYRLNLILPDQPTMPPVSPQELENIREAIAKAQEMKRQREIQKVEHKRQYNRGRYWTLKTGESEREKKQRVDDSLTDMGVDPVALGLSNDAAAVMASMANGVASFIHGRHGRCYLMPQRRDPEMPCFSCTCRSYATNHYFVTKWPVDSSKAEVDTDQDTESSTSDDATNDGTSSTVASDTEDDIGGLSNDCSIKSAISNNEDCSIVLIKGIGGGGDQILISARRTRTTRSMMSTTAAAAAPVVAVVTPPKAPSKSSVPEEKGLDNVTRQADVYLAEEFRLEEAVLGKVISRPLNDRVRSGAICISSYKPRFCLSYSFYKRHDKKRFILAAGKNVLRYSELGGPEISEYDTDGSSSTYHTLLLHDPNARDQTLSGIAVLYYYPVPQTKYWWLSYLTTKREVREDNESKKRRGYGRMIMWRWINLARSAEGVEELFLEVRREWKAVKLYKSLNFEEVDWDLLSAEIKGHFVSIPQDPKNPQSKMTVEHLYKHEGDADFMLMRLKLSVFDK